MFENDENEVGGDEFLGGEVETEAEVEAGAQVADDDPAKVEADAGKAQEQVDAAATAFGLPEVQALLEDAAASGKPLALTADEIRALPHEAKRVLAALAAQASANAKPANEAVQTAAKELEKREAALAERERKVRVERQTLGKVAQAPNVKSLLDALKQQAGTSVDDVDLFTADGIRKLVSVEAAKQSLEHLSKMFGELDAVAEAEKQAQAQADAQAERQAKVERFQSFINEHPDDFDMATMGVMPDGKEAPLRDVIKMFTRDMKMDIEPAHRLALSLRDRANLLSASQETQQAVRAKVVRSRAGTDGIPPRPKNATTEELIAYYDRYPEAVKRDAKPETWGFGN